MSTGKNGAASLFTHHDADLLDPRTRDTVIAAAIPARTVFSGHHPYGQPCGIRRLSHRLQNSVHALQAWSNGTAPDSGMA